MSQYTLEELQKTVLPFGKHKGKTFDEVPLRYLDWMASLEDLKPILREKLEAYLSNRTIQKIWDEEQAK